MGWVRDFVRDVGLYVLVVAMLCCPFGLLFGVWYANPTENGPGGEASCDNSVPMVCTVVFARRVEDPSATAYGKPVRLVAVEGDTAVVEIKALFGWVTSTVRRRRGSHHARRTYRQLQHGDHRRHHRRSSDHRVGRRQ